jgi:hypothetical protein
MRRSLIAAGLALCIAGEVSANAPAPRTKPTTKSTAPKLESETEASSRGSTLLVGSALALALASGGLMAFRWQSKKS